MNAAEIINTIRNECALSNYELAQAMNRSQNMVIDYVKGRREPPFSSVLQLMEAYDYALIQGELVDLKITDFQLKSKSESILEAKLQTLLEDKMQAVVDDAFDNMRRLFERKQALTMVHRVQGTRY